MGNLFGNCFKANDNEGKSKKKKEKKKNEQFVNNANRDRITDADKAILDVKGRLKQIKIYKDKIDIQLKQQDERIRELLRNKQKQRAVIALKHKKFLEKEGEKAYGAQNMLQQTLQNIESAQMDVNVMEALKKGDKVITELREQAKMEDFEELYERHQDQMAVKEKEMELFGQILDEDELEDELNKLEADVIEMQIPDAAQGIVESKSPVRQQQQEEEEEPVAEKKPARQMVPA